MSQQAYVILFGEFGHFGWDRAATIQINLIKVRLDLGCAVVQIF